MGRLPDVFHVLQTSVIHNAVHWVSESSSTMEIIHMGPGLEADVGKWTDHFFSPSYYNIKIQVTAEPSLDAG